MKIVDKDTQFELLKQCLRNSVSKKSWCIWVMFHFKNSS